MTRKKFTEKADKGSSHLLDELTISNTSMETDPVENDINALLETPKENFEERQAASFKDFHSTPSLEHIETKNKTNKKEDKNDEKKLKDGLLKTKKKNNRLEPKNSNRLSRAALGSYIMLKNEVNKEEEELSISEISKITELGKSTAKKHKEQWIINSWIEIIKNHDCSSQRPPTIRFIR